MKKAFYFFCITLLLVAGLVTYLYFTNEGVANEFRQIRQPRPNKFYVGIDVSATIDPNMLSDLKKNVVSRLKNFIGETTVTYSVSSFGNPGCGNESITNVLSVKSPEDEATFDYQVNKKIRTVSVAEINTRDTRPLTTPLYCLLQKVLTERIGSRVIIFSDLMNDDSDCKDQFYFPEETIKKFGENKTGQIIFLYPTPRLTGDEDVNKGILAKQQEFIDQMIALRDEGKVRAFFYHIPKEPLDRAEYIESKLQDAIPATSFEVVFERVTKMVDTVVSAVRG